MAGAIIIVVVLLLIPVLVLMSGGVASRDPRARSSSATPRPRNEGSELLDLDD